MIDNKLKSVVDKIVIEIKKAFPKSDILFGSINDYILGLGNWENLQGEEENQRFILLGHISDEGLSKIVSWCYENMHNKNYYF